VKNSIFIILLFAEATTVLAQVSPAYKTQVESIFQVDRSYVFTGLLQDYGIFYTNVEKFNGVRRDTNYVEYTEWQSLFNSLYTYRFNSNATVPEPSAVFSQVTSAANQNSNAVVLTGLHYRYQRFKSTAVSSDLVYISNDNSFKKSNPKLYCKFG
jgi:hypothetical protein